MIQPQSALTIKGDGPLAVLTSKIQVYTPVVDRVKGPDKFTQEITAVWDTGASGSVISQKVVDELGLLPISLRWVNTANGTAFSPVYLVDFHIPLAKVILQGLNVTLGNLGPDLDALIGMDVINAGDFAITNRGGKTKMSFRVPSQADTDFVIETNKQNALALKNKPPQGNIGRRPRRQR
jgi:predicted aspartyl protease